ncbi:MAG: hypothetical protein U1F76_11170 [Candidatus Competibacteraceae bacterium]
MQSSKSIYSWLVLGPIYNDLHQTARPEDHHPDDGHPMAKAIIENIDKNDTFKPLELTASVEKAPKPGDITTYGNGMIYNQKDYQWRVLSFTGGTWGNLVNIENNIHLSLGPSSRDSKDPLSFFGKHHALVFLLVYIYSPYARETQLCVRSDDSIRVWFNGAEIEPLRYAGERDIGYGPNRHPEETCADISLRKDCNILLAAVAETHVEWGFSARLMNARCLRVSPTPSEHRFDCREDLPST